MSESLDFAAKNILVTGGLGFIGSNLARRLVELGAHVTSHAGRTDCAHEVCKSEVPSSLDHASDYTVVQEIWKMNCGLGRLFGKWGDTLDNVTVAKS
jgi:NAD(P)-dependent dehydrogenase (short-subunit alcohol dehydrogenase family)